MRSPMSPAASGLLRALVARGGCSRDRVLLTELSSEEWHSLTFVGERHHLHMRISGPDGATIASRIATGLEDAEFTIPGHIVADIGCGCAPQVEADGGVLLRIEALTVQE
jgi:hypothetical protein